MHIFKMKSCFHHALGEEKPQIRWKDSVSRGTEQAQFPFPQRRRDPSEMLSEATRSLRDALGDDDEKAKIERILNSGNRSREVH